MLHTIRLGGVGACEQVSYKVLSRHVLFAFFMEVCIDTYAKLISFNVFTK